MPTRSFSLPLYMLHAPLLWKLKATAMLHSSGFWVCTQAHHHLLRHLCDLAPPHADEATSRGYHKLLVAIDVWMQTPIVHVPLIRRLATLPPLCSPLCSAPFSHEDQGAERHCFRRVVPHLLRRVPRIHQNGDRDSLLTSFPLGLPSCPLCRSTKIDRLLKSKNTEMLFVSSFLNT